MKKEKKPSNWKLLLELLFDEKNSNLTFSEAVKLLSELPYSIKDGSIEGNNNLHELFPPMSGSFFLLLHFVLGFWEQYTFS